MADDQQQPGQPPAGAPGSWPPPTPEQNVFQPQPDFAPPPVGRWSGGALAGWRGRLPPAIIPPGPLPPARPCRIRLEA